MPLQCWRWLVLLFGTFLLLLPRLCAQGVEPSSTLRVTTRLVVLDVVVTDKAGRLVRRSLGKDDFRVYEGGVLQTIHSFEAPSAHRMPAGSEPDRAFVNSAADLAKIGNAPVTVLVLDELNSRFEDMSYARQMMVRYLQSQPAVLAAPAVLMLATNTTFQQLHEYTQNRDALLATLKKHTPEVPYKAGSGGPAAVERMAQVLAALQQVAEASSGTPGRKNLLWVGNGFPSVDLATLDPKTTNTLEAAIRRVTEGLLAARVTMWTINPEPGSSASVQVDMPDGVALGADEMGGDPFDAGTINFSDLATSTGGTAYRGRNDLEDVIRESMEQGLEYYTIAYAPTAPATGVDPGRFRPIHLVMRSPDLHATMRSGYFPARPAALNAGRDRTMNSKQAQANLQLELSQALATTIPYNGLAVTVSRSAAGAYTLRVAENGIGWSDPGVNGTSRAEATVAAAWYDQKNRLLGHLAREETYLQESGAGGAVYQLQFDAPPGAVRARFVLRDARSGRMGTCDLKF